MAHVHQADRQDQADDEQGVVVLDRGYLTDGATLYHVERTIVDDAHDELLVELEDCVTLELIVCSAQALAELGMRPVQPLVPYAA